MPRPGNQQPQIWTQRYECRGAYYIYLYGRSLLSTLHLQMSMLINVYVIWDKFLHSRGLLQH